MSTIAYCAGVMIADTRAYSGGRTPIGQKMKIRNLSDGSLVGVVTNKPGMGEAFTKWLEAGGDENDAPKGEHEFSALHVMTNGQVYYYSDGFVPSGPLEGPFFAIGGGAEFALGALYAGASLVDAVKIACLLDPYTAEPMVKLELIPNPFAQVEETPEPEPANDDQPRVINGEIIMPPTKRQKRLSKKKKVA